MAISNNEICLKKKVLPRAQIFRYFVSKVGITKKIRQEWLVQKSKVNGRKQFHPEFKYSVTL